MESIRLQSVYASIFILFQLTYGDIIREDEGFSATFNVVNIGRVVTVIMVVGKVNVWQCALTCIQHLQCESINYHETTHMCELADHIFIEGWVDILDRHWINYATPRPVDGGLSKWVNVSDCSRTCGGGKVTRKRYCNNPAPLYGGRQCVGRTIDKKRCNLQACPKNMALHKPSSQSSTYEQHVAALANDGDIGRGAVTIGTSTWWKVDLLENVDIIRIIIYLGSGHFKRGSYRDLIITTSKDDKKWTVCKHIGEASSYRIMEVCDATPTIARYVKVENSGTLSIVELKVIGTPFDGENFEIKKDNN